MKNLYLLLIFCGANLISYFSYSQINTYPYYQDFESEFATGSDIEFLSGWFGNEVASTSRIYKDKTNGINGTGTLVITPTSSFSGTILLPLNFKNIKNPSLEFAGKSMANGTGTYPSKIELSVSTDAGGTYSSPTAIGNSFENVTSDFSLYTFTFPTSVAEKEGIILKITVKRGTGGTGTAAKVAIDDFRIVENEITREIVNYRDIQINEIFADPTGSKMPDSAILPNAEFIELYNSTDHSVNLKDFALNGAKIPEYHLLPNDYLIICPLNATEAYSAFGQVVSPASWNTLTNTGEKIVLTNAEGEIIDSLSYNLSWYKDKNKQDGGWSLEQRDPNSACHGSFNFTSSTSSIGGTPGKQNTTFGRKAELKIESLKVISPQKLIIHFSNPIVSGLHTGGNSVTSADLSLDHLEFSPFRDSMIVFFNDSLAEGKYYDLKLTNFEDCGHQKESFEITIGTGAAPHFNNIIISEIMADPSPVEELPETEYLEIFNATSSIISLKNLVLTNGKDQTLLPDVSIDPGRYYVLCPATSQHLFDGEIPVLGLSKWLTLSNQGATIILKKADEIIYSVQYSDKWYNDEDKSDGGFALEMVDINNPCMEEGNWSASEDRKGGTPGKSNSVAAQRVDLTGPEFKSIKILNNTEIAVIFNEKLSSRIINPSQINAVPSVDVLKTEVLDVISKELRITFATPLSSKTLYRLSINDVYDCSGNSNSITVSFALPEKIDSSDLILNEILFNPAKGGVDFVEFINTSDKYLDLKTVYIGKETEEGITDLAPIDVEIDLLAPNELLAVTLDKKILKQHYPKLTEAKVYDLKNLPSFPDDEGTIVLIDSNKNIIDRFHYSETFHSKLLKNKEGVSLERISLTNPTDDQNNWHSASSDAGFATPGGKNSQEKSLATTSHNFTINPSVFSPDGDGYNDFVLIEYNYPEAGNAGTIKIFDKGGRKVRTLINNQSFSTSGIIQWDGVTDEGERVPVGAYLVYIEAYNLGGKVEKFKKEVIVATHF